MVKKFDRAQTVAVVRSNVTRSQLEHLANARQLARQPVSDSGLACDTPSVEHDSCLGFDGGCDSRVAQFHAEFRGEPVEIVQAQ